MSEREAHAELSGRVSAVRRRLTWRMLMHSGLRGCLACLTGVVGLAVVAKFRYLGAEPTVWIPRLAGLAVFLGIASGVAMAIWKRPTMLDAAIELDRRGGLKERVSSALAIQSLAGNREAAQPLMQDAIRRANHADIASLFPIAPERKAVLPALTVAGLFLASLLIPNAPMSARADASGEQRKQVENSTKNLRAKLEKQKIRAAELGLDEVSKLLESLDKEVNELAERRNLDRKESLVRLNTLANEVQRRQKEMGDPKQLRREFQNLKELGAGPLRDVAKSLERGEFGQAAEKLRHLAQQLSKNELSAEQRKELGRQLEQVAKSLKERIAEQKQSMQELERKIEQLKNAGDLQQAAKLQDQLNRRKSSQAKLDRLQKMAEQMSECSDCLKGGKPGQNGQAGDQLSQIAAQVDAMQDEMDELDLLESTLNQLAETKDQIGCRECDGAG